MISFGKRRLCSDPILQTTAWIFKGLVTAASYCQRCWYARRVGVAAAREINPRRVGVAVAREINPRRVGVVAARMKKIPADWYDIPIDTSGSWALGAASALSLFAQGTCRTGISAGLLVQPEGLRQKQFIRGVPAETRQGQTRTARQASTE